MKKIGIVSCKKWNGVIKEDVMLCNKLNDLGYDSSIVSWDESGIDFTVFDCLVLRSVWGYQNAYDSFVAWLLDIKRNNILMFNDVAIIFDNMRKDKQFALLDQYRIPHIPTLFIKDYEELKSVFNNETGDMVIKPIISGSGENTFNMGVGDKEEIIRKFGTIMNGSTDNGAMIQPYIPEIKDGEFACVFINGENTHNMLRFPGVFSSSEKPIYLECVPYEVLDLAYRVREIPEFGNHLYMRVDIVYSNGIPVIMEVELTEPDLLIKYIPDMEKRDEIVTKFAKKLERKL